MDSEEIEHKLPEATQRFLAEMPPEHRDNLLALYKVEVERQVSQFFQTDFEVHKWYVEHAGVEYFQKRNSSSETKRGAAERFERSILGFSVGAIALSITFLQVISEPPVSTAPLIVSWLGFGAATLTMLAHLVFTQHAFDDQIATYDRQYDRFVQSNVTKQRTVDYDETKLNKWKTVTNVSY